uniref:ANK_REP_REGION domain-containing protein n=2 Tax=Macrostomum lignano TaxID=282301 RepID=A0A1I8H716_9PLAT
MAKSSINIAPDYNQYPWRHVNSIHQVFHDSPVLLSLELTTLSLYSLLILHAIRRRKLSVLLAATISGAVNEVVFTSLPIVNNFWHAQAWLMLGPRLPAWQPALYGLFIYVACQSADILHSFGWNSRIGRAAVAGILAFLLLFPMDAVCVRFVAYTWHDSDPLLADRVMGVAAGNGMFAVAFPFCFAALTASSRRFGPAIACLLSTPSMVLLTLPLDQFVGDGVPTQTSLIALLVGMTSIVVVAASFTSGSPESSKTTADLTIPLVGFIYYLVLLSVSILADPAGQKSVGFHQPLSPIGPCLGDITDLSASGRQRQIYLCPNELSAATRDVLDPTCDPTRSIDQHWYVVCGRPFDSAGNSGGSRRTFVIKLACIAALGMLGLTSCQRGLSIAQESPYVLPRIEAPIQQFKDAVKHCEKWLEGAEPVMEQLHHLQQLPDHERGNVKNQVLLLASALGKWPLVSKLLHNDADPNCEHESSKLTPLHLTTLGGHVSTTQTLLSVPSINVNATDAAGNTPLMCAAQSGFHALVAPLLNHSADYSARNNKGYTAFDVALANGRIKVLKMLMEKWNPLDATNLEEKRNFYKACCFEASKNSWTDILALLENHGVSLNIQSESAADLVLTSCVYMQEGILHFLVARDVPLDQPEHEGMRPLFHACYNGSFNMVKLLCEKHADINAQDSQGRSPAFMAAAGGHLQILQHLEEQECDLNVITKSGDSLLEAAIDSGNFELFVYLRERVQRPANSRATLAHRAAEKLRTDILEAELSEDRDLIEKEDFDGNTPLLLACQRGSKQLLTLLQKLGADFSHANQKGNTPALLLSAIGNLQLLQIVHKAGGDLDHPNWKGDTPILMACRYNHFSVVKFFSDHGCTMDCANYLGQTPAFFSARHAKKELLRFLVEQKAPVDDETTDGMTPLLVAAKADHTESVKILLRSNCRVEQVNSEGRNIVSFSAINGNVEMLNMAIENKADLLVRETSGNTAVIDACRYGRLEVLEILSKQACPLDAKNYESRSGLHLAAEFGFIKIANFLLEKEVNCNSRDKLGNTPLMLAAEKGFDKIIQLLNQKECDVHLHNKEGKTALHFASLGNNTRSIQLLLIAGCNPMQTDNAGATPLMLSCQSSKPEDKNSNEAFKMLCEFSATDGRRSLFFYDNRMQTCVHYAAEVGQYRILEELHNLGLRMDEPNRDGETPLIIAAKGRYRKSVEFLITKCSASVSAVDNKGQSAVHKAALKGHLPVVQLLETNGAEMDRPDSCGRTPLLLAASRGFDSIVNFLQDKRCIDTIVCRERNENILHLAAIGSCRIVYN